MRETAISFELDPPDALEMRRRIETTLGRYPWLVCEDGGAVLAYAYGGPHRPRPAYQWAADVSVYTRRDVHRRGLGRALYEALLQLLEAQGFVAAYAGITLPNDASVGLHESFGFRQYGAEPGVGYKLGAWHDVSRWTRPLAPRTTQPRPPVWLPALPPAAVATAIRAGERRLRSA